MMAPPLSWRSKAHAVHAAAVCPERAQKRPLQKASLLVLHTRCKASNGGMTQGVVQQHTLETKRACRPHPRLAVAAWGRWLAAASWMAINNLLSIVNLN